MNRVSASDYIKAKKQNAIYTELKNNAYTNITINPVKNNGLTYNDNISILLNSKCVVNDCSGGQLNHAKNYDLLYDFNNGKMYNYSRCSTCNTSSNCCSCFTCAFK
jgi:hypothetical protein